MLPLIIIILISKFLFFFSFIFFSYKIRHVLNGHLFFVSLFLAVVANTSLNI